MHSGEGESQCEYHEISPNFFAGIFMIENYIDLTVGQFLIWM
jgi:hypothetical protein